MMISLLFLLGAFSTASAQEAPHGYFDRFQSISSEHRDEIRKEGLSYMLGGGAAFGLSLGLGLTSEEVLPKVGYSLIQTLSAAAFYYGAVSYYDGDRLSKEGERLALLNETLKNSKLSEKERKSILDKSTLQAIQREKMRQQNVRKIRGYVALSTAVSSGLTIALSKSDSTASNISLGFIFLVSTIGATSDLLLPEKPTKVKELFTLQPEIGIKSVGAKISLRW